MHSFTPYSEGRVCILQIYEFPALHRFNDLFHVTHTTHTNSYNDIPYPVPVPQHRPPSESCPQTGEPMDADASGPSLAQSRTLSPNSNTHHQHRATTTTKVTHGVLLSRYILQYPRELLYLFLFGVLEERGDGFGDDGIVGWVSGLGGVGCVHEALHHRVFHCVAEMSEVP